VTYSGVAAWIKIFADVNKCQQSPVTTNASSKATREYWGPCENGNEVIFYTIAGIGHDYATSEKYDFSATDTFWTFFKAHPWGTVAETKK
jgi:poly(3-hydroxybutyrate) depolymerase